MDETSFSVVLPTDVSRFLPCLLHPSETLNHFRVVMLVTDSLSFPVSEHILSALSLLKGSFIACSNLGW